MLMLAATRCPYCGYLQNYRVEPANYNGETVVRCDMEDGGCDRLYAIFWTVKLTAETHGIMGQHEIYERHLREAREEDA